LVYYKKYKIDFNYSIFSNVGSVIYVQNPNYKKKIVWNICMSDARLLSFENLIVYYG